jgi:hypothetical protein
MSENYQRLAGCLNHIYQSNYVPAAKVEPGKTAVFRPLDPRLLFGKLTDSLEKPNLLKHLLAVSSSLTVAISAVIHVHHLTFGLKRLIK